MPSEPIARAVSGNAPTPGRILIEGLLLGLGVTVLAGWIMLKIFNRWYVGLDVDPDFSTNGVQWLAVGMVTVVLPVQLAANLAMIGIVLPVRYNGRIKRDGLPINPWIATALAVAVAAVVSLLMIGWGGTHVILSMVAGPWLTVLAVGVPLFVRRLNAALQPGPPV